MGQCLPTNCLITTELGAALASPCDCDWYAVRSMFRCVIKTWLHRRSRSSLFSAMEVIWSGIHILTHDGVASTVSGINPSVVMWPCILNADLVLLEPRTTTVRPSYNDLNSWQNQIVKAISMLWGNHIIIARSDSNYLHFPWYAGYHYNLCRLNWEKWTHDDANIFVWSHPFTKTCIVQRRKSFALIWSKETSNFHISQLC